jgi:2-polyprenyl-3-methyl-5-hydroxy-6-metoxy-1,4-benzoquinol methylase
VSYLSEHKFDRQYGRGLDEIRPDHLRRYALAASYVSGRVLDAACGCGYGSFILQKAAPVVVGVDRSAQAIGWAEEHFAGPEYIRGQIEDAPWAGQFDTVVSLETLEHLRDPKPALDAFRASCSGVLVASVPNEERYPFKAENFVRDESPHFRHYRPTEFQELLEASGFKVIERFCQKDKLGEIHGGTDGMFLIYVAE